MNLVPTWTDERIDRMRKLAEVDKMSTSEIAKALGGVTRNAVIGKCQREAIKLTRGTSRTRKSMKKRPGDPRRDAWLRDEPILREMHAAGASASSIAERLGRPRHQVWDKAQSLGLVWQQRAGQPARPKATVPFVEIVETAPANPVHFIDLRQFRSDAPNQCRRFLGGQHGAHGLVCAAATPPGDSWCPSCAKVLMVPVSVAEARMRKAAA